jgi:hypothetical protein
VPLEDSTDAAADDTDDVMSRSDTPLPPWTVIPLTDMYAAEGSPSNATSTSSSSSSKPAKKKSSKKKAGGEADAGKDPSLPGPRPLAPSTTAFLARAARVPQALQAAGAGAAAAAVTVGSSEEQSSGKSEPLAAALTRDVARDLTRVVQAASGAGGSTPAVRATVVLRSMLCMLWC